MSIDVPFNKKLRTSGDVVGEDDDSRVRVSQSDTIADQYVFLTMHQAMDILVGTYGDTGSPDDHILFTAHPFDRTKLLAVSEDDWSAVIQVNIVGIKTIKLSMFEKGCGHVVGDYNEDETKITWDNGQIWNELALEHSIIRVDYV